MKFGIFNMRTIGRLAAVTLTGLALAGCAGTTQDAAVSAPAASAKPVASAKPAARPAPAADSLATAIAGPWRSEADRARDVFRHPYETLTFFGVKPDQVVVEITPGGGWYSAILAPWLAKGGGTYVVGTADPAKMSERGRANFEAFKGRYADSTVFGTLQFSKFGPQEDGACPAGTADVVLTFRNVHNWMTGGWAEKAFADMAKCLKPGGVLGLVEHRAFEESEFDPKGSSGYIKVSTMKAFAEKAGLVFEAESDVNFNPKDTRDHPYGVWTLPPVRNGAPADKPDPSFDRAKYDAIGESDRATLRFRKPAN